MPRKSDRDESQNNGIREREGKDRKIFSTTKNEPHPTTHWCLPGMVVAWSSEVRPCQQVHTQVHTLWGREAGMVNKEYREMRDRKTNTTFHTSSFGFVSFCFFSFNMCGGMNPLKI